MKKQYLAIIFLIAISAIIGCSNSKKKNNILWISSNQNALWQIDTIKVKNPNITSGAVVTVFSDSSLQTIDGFGGCFNELGWEALNYVTKEEQKKILEALFDTINGCKFNICRMPIGANDYAVDWYSHNETPEDFNMDNFSVARDRKRLIPYINEAHKINPAIQIWASPWCPPSWMKKNKNYACQWHPDVNTLPKELSSMEELVSRFIMEPEYLQAYATYFAKFVEAYQQEGIEISAVHVQNEPNSSQNFPSCVWKPKDLGIFIADYLAPEFQSRNINTEIWLGTIERPQIERVDSVLQYKNVLDIVEGVGFQWAGKGVIPEVNKKYSALKLMQTETECGNGSNDWDAAVYTFNLMNHYFNNGANSYMYWNMILNETGKSQWGWKQNSMITIDSKTKKMVYNPEFYLMKHFSAFIEPGFSYIKTSDKNCLAFKKAEQYVLVYYNAEDKSVEKEFTIDKTTFKANLTPNSFNTFVVEI
jgi:glucosylceramidase